MPRGASKGQRRGGRIKGTPNKVTVERTAVAMEVLRSNVRAGKKLAIDVLDELMILSIGLAAKYQEWPASAGVNPTEDVDKFFRYAEFGVLCAGKLSQHQSPTFKAIAVIPPPPQMLAAPTDKSNVIELNDADAASRVYRRIVMGGK